MIGTTRRAFLQGLGGLVALLAWPFPSRAAAVDWGVARGTGAAVLIDEPNTWYHVWALPGPDGVIDWAFDTDDLGRNLVTKGYATPPAPRWRRVGSIVTDDSGDVRRFRQVGETFTWEGGPE